MLPDRLQTLLDNTNGRQRRQGLLYLILALSLLTIVVLLLRGRSTDNLPGEFTEDTLRVATHLPTGAHVERPHHSSFNIELDLAREFAKANGLGFSVIRSRDRQHSLAMLASGEADIAITGTIEPGSELPKQYRVVGTREVSLQLIGMQGPSPAPFSLAEIHDQPIAVIADTPLHRFVEELRAHYPNITLDAWPRATSDLLLDNLMDERIRYAILQSDEFLVLQHLYPELIDRLTLPGLFPVGWVLKQQGALSSMADHFLHEYKTSGAFQNLLASHHEHLWDFNYTDASTYLKAIDDILPDHEILFRTAGEDFALDWQLLAAMAWQESHWDPNARSRTGVRGIMMLTERTAAEVQVTDRLDPAQSIHGGARYLASLLEQLPENIPEAERPWFALASYNVGAGHLADAIALAESLGEQADNWQTLKTYLPLLSDPRWAAKTRYGTARGQEPVDYVRKTRQYYDILRWINLRKQPEMAAVTANNPW